MIPVLSAAETRKADQWTISKEPVTSENLMERASGIFTNWFCEQYGPEQPVCVVAGMGNNGGDGLCIARMLQLRAYEVSVYIVKSSEKGSEDFEKNLRKLEAYLTPFELTAETELLPDFSEKTVIDAVFGSGLNRPLTGWIARLVKTINGSAEKIVAVDIPSGLFADKPMTAPITAITATSTLSFEYPKLAFLLPETGKFCGKWKSLSIGLDAAFLDTIKKNHFVFEPHDLRKILKPRHRFAHKGDFGHAVTIGGSSGKQGAVWLSAMAALKSGAGLSSCVLVAEKPDHNPVFPELMHIRADAVNEELLKKFDVIAIGPGLGLTENAYRLFKLVLKTVTCPIVIDADAINLLAKHTGLQKLLGPNMILTPHPGEFRRLAGPAQNDYHQLELLRKKAAELNATVVLKGAYTAVASGGAIYFNLTGNPGMATAGSGDVLTGIIAALLATGLTGREAASAAVCAHGLAGDLASAQKSGRGMTSADILHALPEVWLQLENGQL